MSKISVRAGTLREFLLQHFEGKLALDPEGPTGGEQIGLDIVTEVSAADVQSAVIEYYAAEGFNVQFDESGNGRIRKGRLVQHIQIKADDWGVTISVRT